MRSLKSHLAEAVLMSSEIRPSDGPYAFITLSSCLCPSLPVSGTPSEATSPMPVGSMTTGMPPERAARTRPAGPANLCWVRWAQDGHGSHYCPGGECCQPLLGDGHEMGTAAIIAQKVRAANLCWEMGMAAIIAQEVRAANRCWEMGTSLG